MAETIEGYRFTVDLDDRGMRTKLSDLAKEARTLKSIMRANFNENMSVGIPIRLFHRRLLTLIGQLNSTTFLSSKLNRILRNYLSVLKRLRKSTTSLPMNKRKIAKKANG